MSSEADLLEIDSLSEGSQSTSTIDSVSNYPDNYTAGSGNAIKFARDFLKWKVIAIIVSQLVIRWRCDCQLNAAVFHSRITSTPLPTISLPVNPDVSTALALDFGCSISCKLSADKFLSICCIISSPTTCPSQTIGQNREGTSDKLNLANEMNVIHSFLSVSRNDCLF